MAEAFIIDAVRTPLGKGRQGGALSGVHPLDLLAHPLAALVERTGIDPRVIDGGNGCYSSDRPIHRPVCHIEMGVMSRPSQAHDAADRSRQTKQEDLCPR